MNRNYDKMLEDIINSLDLGSTPKLLIHSCCAPCSSYCLEYLSKYFDITVFYYNPNISPLDEFVKRSKEQIRFINEFKASRKVKYVIMPYDNSEFESAINGLQNTGEGGPRCFKCYRLRMEAAARYAKENGFDYFTTTLSISPYKNSNKLNEIGEILEKEIGVKYLYADFKKKNGYKRSIELSREYKLYRQDYCGCKYSKVEAEKRKQIKKLENKTKIEIDRLNVSKKNLVKLGVIIALFLPVYLFLTNVIFACRIKVANDICNIDSMYIYGRHLNMSGSIKLDNIDIKKVSLYFYSKKNSIDYDINYKVDNNNLIFNISDKINDGYNLETLKEDNYNIFLKVSDDENIYYYSLKNNTKYKDTTYYSVGNEKLVFNSDNKYNTIGINMNKYSDKNIVDVVIDPGHGGKDSGACSSNVCETDYTLNLANLLKSKLEEKGLKVALTRDTNDTLKTYGDNSRTSTGFEKKAKLVISLHMNKLAVGSGTGFEVYTPLFINYDFAKSLVESIDKVNNFTVSNGTNYKVDRGLYTRNFSEVDVNNVLAEGYKNVSTNTNYYYMIRETGGYITGAYRSDNKYKDSNVGPESYIIELGYISSASDRTYVNNYKIDYMKAVASSISNYLK